MKDIEVIITQESRELIKDIVMYSEEEIDNLIYRIKNMLQKILEEKVVWNTNYSIVEDCDFGYIGVMINNSRYDKLIIYITYNDLKFLETPIIKLTFMGKSKYIPIMKLLYRNDGLEKKMWIEGLLDFDCPIDINIPQLENDLQKILEKVLEKDEFKKIYCKISKKKNYEIKS